MIFSKRTVASIVKRLTAITTALEAHEEANRAEAERHERCIDEHNAAITEAMTEAANARRIANKLQDLLA